MRPNKFLPVLLSLLAMLVVLAEISSIKFPTPQRVTSIKALEPSKAPTFFVTQTIINSGTTIKTEQITVTEGETALDVLARTAEIETKQSSLGILVDSINGYKNGTEGKFWLYYLNDQIANKGAGEYVLQPNDTIKWQFSSYEN